MTIEKLLADISSRAATNLEEPRPKVLVVDNERVIADTLAMLLSQHGYQSSVAYGGSEGLRKVRELKPDMVISDIVHDEPNGIDMAIQIHAETPETTIFLFSGQAASADLMKKALAEGHSFLANVPLLAKPVHPQVLLCWFKSGGNPDALRE